MFKKTSILMMVALLAVTISACKPNRPKGCPKLYPCTVQIIQGGSPLEGATVDFIPSDPSLSKWAVNSVTDAEGKVHLMTQTFPGAPLGVYKVTVAKLEVDMSKMPPVPIQHVGGDFPDPNATPASIEVVKGMTEPVVIDVGDPQ